MLLAVTGPTGAVDVSHLSDIEQDPCFQQAHQRALDHQLGVIESQIVDACIDAHGNPTEAIALLTERAKTPSWLPPASGRMSATGVLLAVLAELAVLSVLLGVDIGYASRALGLPLPSAPMSIALLVARLGVALLMTGLVALPGLDIVLCIGLLIFAVRICRWHAPTLPAEFTPDDPSGQVANSLSMIVTDLLGNSAITFGIAVASRGSLIVATAGVLVAALAARLLHRRLGALLQRRPIVTRAAGAAVATIAGLAALADPALSILASTSMLVLAMVPLCCAGAVLIVGLRPHGIPPAL